MLRRWILPVIIFLFGLLSLMTLKSIAPDLLGKQLLYFVIGSILFTATARVSFLRLQMWSPYLYGALIFFLLLTHFIGRVTRGATSWIPIGPFHMEPSQLAIVFVGLLITFLLRKHEMTTAKHFIWYALLVALPAGLIFWAPELGTTIIYCLSLASVFLLSKTPAKFLVLSLASIAVISFVAWNFLLRSYQKDRITSFVNAQQDQQGASYNALQSMIAVGSGEVYGRGIGQGIQSHLRFLPERQTDFVFASFAEEMGLVGALPIILLYAGLTGFLIMVSWQLTDISARYFCFLTAAMIAAQAGINIGMNMGILPITGITLPLMSYGGSSVVALCFQFGCVQSIIHEFRKKETLFIR